MESLRERLDDLKRQQEQARDRKARAEATLEQLKAQEAQILSELSELGVAPESLPAEVERLAEEVQRRLDEAAQILQGVESV